MTRCRRKPLEFECWTWDGTNSPPSWLGEVMPGTATDRQCLWIDTGDNYRPLFIGGVVVREHNRGNEPLTPAEFAAEFDLLGVVLPPGCKCSVDEWANVCNPICSEFNPIKSCSKICHTCEHPRGCHAH